MDRIIDLVVSLTSTPASLAMILQITQQRSPRLCISFRSKDTHMKLLSCFLLLINNILQDIRHGRRPWVLAVSRWMRRKRLQALQKLREGGSCRGQAEDPTNSGCSKTRPVQGHANGGF